MSYPHNETPLCQQHGCPDHGRRETEWMQIEPGCQVTLNYCTISTWHKYTYHLCNHHDVILINERGEL